MANTLAFFTYGRQAKTGELALLHVQGDLTLAQAQQYQQSVPLDAPDTGDALCVIRVEPEFFVVAHAQQQEGAPLLRYVRVPTAALRALQGDLAPLVALFDAPPAPDMTLPATQAWTQPLRQHALERALQLCEGDMTRLFCLLQLALMPEGGWVQGFAGDRTQTLTLLQGLTLLLPAPLRYYLTFSTYSLRLPPNRPRLIFAPQESATTRTRWQWGDWDVTLPLTAGAAFMAHLRALWQGDLTTFLGHLEMLDDIAEHMHTLDIGLAQNVDLVAARHALDLAVLAPQAHVALDDLLNHVRGDNPPEGELYVRYLERLLTLTLEERHAVAAAWLAQHLDDQPALAQRLNPMLDAALVEQPDALYAFVRAYLSERSDTSEAWLARLHASARAALALALESGDPPTIGGWLQLLAREPLRYALEDILREGLLAALPTAYTSDALARDVLVIACKREPSLVATLLDDARFTAALAPALRAALLQDDVEALQGLVESSRELFLLGLARLIDHASSPKLTPALVAALWDILLNKPNLVIAESYRPLTLVRALTSSHCAALQPTALENLLALMLADHQDALFYEAAHELAQQEVLAPLLPNVLIASWRDSGDVLALLNTLLAQSTITPQTAVNTLVAMLNGRRWDDKPSAPLVEQLGRLVHQHSDVRVSSEVLWRLAEFASENKHELIAKGVTKRLLTEFSSQEDETQLCQNVQQLRKLHAPFPALKSTVKAWWREQIHRRSLAALQRLDRALEGNRALEDLRPTVASALGLRRALNGRSLEAWAQDISVTFRVLQALSDGLDALGSDDLLELAALRAEVDQLLGEVAPDLRQVLATNLKQLVTLIATLADNRTKPSLIRGDDALERQLVAGEVTPQGAVDVLRWLAGYLEDSTQSSSS